MNSKISFCLFIFLILALPIISAQDEDPTFQFNREFDLKRVCSDGGFFCGSDFECNITLVYPNGNILINNQVMTNQISFRNITINQSLNNQLGFIKAMESCNNVSSAGLETFDVAITADGKKFQIFPIQIVLIIIGLIMICVGITLDRLRLFKHLGSMFIMVMGVVTLYPGYSFINYSTLIGKVLGFTLVGIGFYFLIEDSFSRDKQEETYDQRSEFQDD